MIWTRASAVPNSLYFTISSHKTYWSTWNMEAAAFSSILVPNWQTTQSHPQKLPS
jgi:hypothetical protein